MWKTIITSALTTGATLALISGGRKAYGHFTAEGAKVREHLNNTEAKPSKSSGKKSAGSKDSEKKDEEELAGANA